MSDTGDPGTYNLSCHEMIMCERMAMGMCPKGYKVLGHVEYGPHEHDIQVGCNR
jgi:hypothetical protein